MRPGPLSTSRMLPQACAFHIIAQLSYEVQRRVLGATSPRVMPPTCLIILRVGTFRAMPPSNWANHIQQCRCPGSRPQRGTKGQAEPSFEVIREQQTRISARFLEAPMARVPLPTGEFSNGARAPCSHDEQPTVLRGLDNAEGPLVSVGETSQPTCLIGVARLCLKAVESRGYNPAIWPAADVELNNLSLRNFPWPSRSPVPGGVMTHCQPAAYRGRGKKRSREKRSFLPIRAHGKFIEASATRARLPQPVFKYCRGILRIVQAASLAARLGKSRRAH